MFAVVQPATVPLKPSNSRAKVVLIFMFLGFVGSAAWKLFGADFIRDFLANAKTKMKEDITIIIESVIIFKEKIEKDIDGREGEQKND